MSKGRLYVLVALPQSIALANEHDEALTTLRSTVTTEHGDTHPFRIPTFKIGTLDALVQQADDLAKLTADSEVVVERVADALNNLLEGDQEKIAQTKNVNDKPVEQYLQSFSWNKVKYRSDKPIGEILDTLKNELVGTDNDVKSKFAQHNTTKNNLIQLQRKQAGNLSTKSLASVVNPNVLVQDSEYLETHLIAIPKSSVKDFYKTYETLVPDCTVPRSAMEVEKDSEFTLVAVTTFRKFSGDFLHKCREKRWIPRDYKHEANGKEEEQKELKRLEDEEQKLWGESLRLGRTGYSEAVMTWMHAFALRVFVESVLRYGLPAEYVCGIVKTNPKSAKKAKQALDMAYGHLGGNAVSRDKKGRVKKEDANTSSEMQAAGHGETEYTPYVYYEFEVA